MWEEKIRTIFPLSIGSVILQLGTILLKCIGSLTDSITCSYKIRSHNDYVSVFEKVPIKVDSSVFCTLLVPTVKTPIPCVGY